MGVPFLLISIRNSKAWARTKPCHQMYCQPTPPRVLIPQWRVYLASVVSYLFSLSLRPGWSIHLDHIFLILRIFYPSLSTSTVKETLFIPTFIFKEPQESQVVGIFACTEQVSDSQEERICQKPMMTVPCSLISSLQIVTKQILCCLSHPVCDTFLLTALKDQYSPPDELWFRDSNIYPITFPYFSSAGPLSCLTPKAHWLCQDCHYWGVWQLQAGRHK